MTMQEASTTRAAAGRPSRLGRRAGIGRILPVGDGGPLGYQLQVSDPKTRNGRRTVDLDGRTVAALRAHHARQAEERLVGAGMDRPGHVFVREDGTRVHPDTMTQMFDRHVRQG